MLFSGKKASESGACTTSAEMAAPEVSARPATAESASESTAIATAGPAGGAARLIDGPQTNRLLPAFATLVRILIFHHRPIRV